MARAAWKYHFFQTPETEVYINYLIDDVKPEQPLTDRKITITKFNYFIPCEVYTGKWLVDKNLTKYHTSFKLGQFKKNKKPFYIRKKKKKNVTKKNPISFSNKHTPRGC